VRVKICGFMRKEDAKIACDLGADMIGVISIPNSRRYLDNETAKLILDEAPDGVSKVAVVMPRSSNDLQALDAKLKPDYLQIHLTLPLTELYEARKQLDSGLILVTSIPPTVTDRRVVIENAIRAAEVADILLIDTKGPSGGGTGLSHDWTISREIKSKVNKPVFLAGGLKPSNVVAAIKAVKPDGVDVSSGVESNSGFKDPELMEEFIKAARGK